MLRPPVIGATGLVALAGTTAVLLTAIGTTAFDGAKEGPLFNGMLATSRTRSPAWGSRRASGSSWRSSSVCWCRSPS